MFSFAKNYSCVCFQGFYLVYLKESYRKGAPTYHIFHLHSFVHEDPLALDTLSHHFCIRNFAFSFKIQLRMCVCGGKRDFYQQPRFTDEESEAQRHVTALSKVSLWGSEGVLRGNRRPPCSSQSESLTASRPAGLLRGDKQMAAFSVWVLTWEMVGSTRAINSMGSLPGQWWRGIQTLAVGLPAPSTAWKALLRTFLGPSSPSVSSRLSSPPAGCSQP